MLAQKIRELPSQKQEECIKRPKVKPQTTPVISKHVKRRLIVFFIFSGIIMIYGGIILLSQTIEIHQKKDEYTALKKELKKLKSEENSLEEEIKRLNDDDYLMKLARKEYFLSEKGEIIFHIDEKKGERGR